MRYSELNEDWVGKIDWPESDEQKAKFDPENPSMAIRGMYVITYNTLKKSLADELAGLSEKISRQDPESASITMATQLVGPTEVILHKMKAFIDVTEELKDRHVRGKLTRMKKKDLFNTIKNSHL